MRIPLSAEVISRDGRTGRDATLKNGLAEANGEDAIIRKRPGMYDLGSVGAGAAQLLAPWQGKLVGVAGDLITSSEILAGVSENRTAIGTSAEMVYEVAVNGDTWVAVCNDALPTWAGYGIYRSTNAGVTWANVNSSSNDFRSLVYGNGLFVAHDLGVGTNDIRYSSNNGATWATASSGITGTGSRLIFAGGVFFVIGQNGALATSTNAASWTNRSISTTDDFSGVAYGAGKYVIGSTQGNAWTSSNLSSWAQNNTGATAGLFVGAYGNGLFVGLSDSYEVWTSENGELWANTAYLSAFYDSSAQVIPKILFSGTKFFIISDLFGKSNLGDGVVSSSNGIDWDSINTGITGGLEPLYPALLSDGIVSGGRNDTLMVWRDVEMISVVTSLALSPATADLDLWFSLSGAAASSQYLFLKNAEQGFLLDSTLTLSEITDVDYPASTVPGVVWLDGTFYVMDATARIYGSDLNNPAAWNALNFITAIKEPGAGVALAKSQNYVIAFKEWSKELFFDAGNATGSPLSPVDNGFSLVGCASGPSVAEVDGTLFWVSQTKQNGRGVHMMVGLEEKEITTPSIQRILNRDDLSQVCAYGLRVGGAICYILTLKTTGVTLVYNAQSGKWSEWSSLTAKASKSCTITQSNGVATVTCAAHGLSDGDPVMIAGAAQGEYNGRQQAMVIDSNTFAFIVPATAVSPATGTITATGYTSSYFKLTKHVKAIGRDLLLHETNGHVYTPKDTAGSDDAPIDFVIRTGKFDGGSEARKTLASASLIGNKSDSVAMMRWSDDDYQTNSKYRHVDLSQGRAKLSRCGSFRRRSFDIRHVADTTLQLVALELETGA